MCQRGLTANEPGKKRLRPGIGRKVNGTCRECTKYGRAKAAVEAGNSMGLGDSAGDRSNGTARSTRAGGLHAGAEDVERRGEEGGERAGEAAG